MKTNTKKTAALLMAFGLTAAACGSTATDVVDDAAGVTEDVVSEVEDVVDGDDDAVDDSSDDSTSDDSTSSDEDSADADADDGQENDSDDAPEDIPATVVDVALSSDDFSTLVAAVTEAELVETLQGEGPFTVFAPTNDAFEALFTNAGITAEELLATSDLADTLTYHVIAGEVLAEDAIAADGTAVETVNGATIDISVVDGTVMLNGAASVVTADLVAGNGVVHVIDTVITPG